MTTKVIFRKFKQGGDVIALFPEIPGDMNPYRTCQSYMHIGQHGAASVDLTDVTVPARPDEYKSLLIELESIGYSDLKIAKRFTYKDLCARREAVEEGE